MAFTKRDSKGVLSDRPTFTGEGQKGALTERPPFSPDGIIQSGTGDVPDTPDTPDQPAPEIEETDPFATLAALTPHVIAADNFAPGYLGYQPLHLHTPSVGEGWRWRGGGGLMVNDGRLLTSGTTRVGGIYLARAQDSEGNVGDPLASNGFRQRVSFRYRHARAGGGAFTISLLVGSDSSVDFYLNRREVDHRSIVEAIRFLDENEDWVDVPLTAGVHEIVIDVGEDAQGPAVRIQIDGEEEFLGHADPRGRSTRGKWVGISALNYPYFAVEEQPWFNQIENIIFSGTEAEESDLPDDVVTSLTYYRLAYFDLPTLLPDGASSVGVGPITVDANGNLLVAVLFTTFDPFATVTAIWRYSFTTGASEKVTDLPALIIRGLTLTRTSLSGIGDMAVDPSNGDILISIWDKIYRFDGDEWDEGITDQVGHYFHGVLVAPNGDIFTGRTVRQYDNSRWTMRIYNGEEWGDGPEGGDQFERAFPGDRNTRRYFGPLAIMPTGQMVSTYQNIPFSFNHTYTTYNIFYWEEARPNFRAHASLWGEPVPGVPDVTMEGLATMADGTILLISESGDLYATTAIPAPGA